MKTEYCVSDLEPASLFHFFEEISAIPRPSGHEEKVRDYLCRFAEEQHLTYRTDQNRNVLICKEASPGYEDHPAVMLQAHTDMVCQTASGVIHDFETQGVTLVRSGDWLHADGTTLGGDDGSGVALMLALLDAKEISHPKLECLFTTEEETGLTGAGAWDPVGTTARRLINLDSEEEGVAVVGCAGGCNTTFTVSYETVDRPEFLRVLRVTVTGLPGGHSGTEIRAGHANAIKTLGALLTALYDQHPFNLLSITGGTAHNAIAREATALIAVLDKEAAEASLRQTEQEIRSDMIPQEQKTFRLWVDKAKTSDFSGIPMMTFRSTGNFLAFLTLVPYGVLKETQQSAMPPESSSNPGILQTDTANKEIRLLSLNRASRETRMNETCLLMDKLGKLAGAAVQHTDRYAAWEYSLGSPLQTLFCHTWRQLYPNAPAPQIAATHGGMECGILASKLDARDSTLPKTDIIAIGPEILSIHSPDERMSLSSFQRLYALVCAMLRQM